MRPNFESKNWLLVVDIDYCIICFSKQKLEYVNENTHNVLYIFYSKNEEMLKISWLDKIDFFSPNSDVWSVLGEMCLAKDLSTPSHIGEKNS